MQLLKSGANIKESVSSNSPDTLLYLFSVYKRKWTFFHKCLSAVWIWPRHWIYIISIKPFTVPWWLGVLFFFLKKKAILEEWSYSVALSLCVQNNAVSLLSQPAAEGESFSELNSNRSLKSALTWHCEITDTLLQLGSRQWLSWVQRRHSKTTALYTNF